MTRIKKGKSVSILTITQNVRFECIKILYQMILKQTYKNILEWVLVEGSQNINDARQNKQKINEFIKNKSIKINYIEFSGRKLGGLRNLGNQSCSGDIIVCMDDDDYYPPERIEEAVEKLIDNPCLIGGVSDVYLYDFFMDKLYKFKGFMEYHSTNNCMAYKKEYLLTHSHDPNIEVGEERSFTLEFSTPLVKFDSRKTIIAISHNFNTFNKRELCLGGTLKTLNTLTEIDEPITNYIDITIWNQMKLIYLKEEQSKYDIVFLLGGFTKKFNPKNIDLDEGETSLMELSKRFVNNGLSVAIYADITFDDLPIQDQTVQNQRKEIDKKNNELIDTNINGIQYINWKKFPFNHHFKTLILHRTNGFLSGALFPIKASKVIWDVHDNFINNDQLKEFYLKYYYKINKIMFKSNFHKYEFEKYLKIMPKSYEIVPNGLRIDKFAYNFENVERNPYRFCYVNYYDRGLDFIVRGIFSVIKTIEPRAELHIYTGMDMIHDNNFKIKMIELFSEYGVADHGKQPIEIIAREKHLSNFELYPSNIINEIDCISIRESLVAGCIPLIANFGVFNERDGIKFDINHEDPKNLKRTALLILNLLKDQSKLNELRETFKRSSSICSWDQIYNIWSQYI
jgi:glycosyltransferase involved in cell wall biosynthesis